MTWNSTLLLRSLQLVVTLDKPLYEWSSPKKWGISLYQGVRSFDCRIILQVCAGVPGVSPVSYCLHLFLFLPLLLYCLHLMLRLEPFLSSANITNSKNSSRGRDPFCITTMHTHSLEVLGDLVQMEMLIWCSLVAGTSVSVQALQEGDSLQNMIAFLPKVDCSWENKQ